MGKLIVIGIIAAVAVFAITNMSSLNFGGSDNAGLKVAEATNSASAQAGKLIGVFDAVNPHSVPVNPPQTTSGAAPNTASDASPNTGGSIPEIVSPADTAVKDAYNWMVYYATESGVDSQHKYIEAANTLKEEWSPRYKSARVEYNKLSHHVEFSKKTAEEYFAIQRGLTDQIQNPESRAKSREADQMEIEVYQKWAEQADKTVLMAYKIMQDLEDMDVIIAKTNLSAHFAALNSSAQTLPASMTALHEELNYFRQASQDINATFRAGSFEESQ